jgi:hypothetical protein
MKKHKFNPVWLVIVVLAIAPIVYFVFRIGDPQFVDNTMGNWFATMVGLAAGVPIGLWINHRQQEEQERAQKQELDRVARERKIKILSLIRKELSFNKDILDGLVRDQESRPGVFCVTGLKVVLWDALSDGGELQWIDDLELLDRLTNAYYHLTALIFLERQYFDPYFQTAVTSDDGRNTYAGERVVRNVTNMRPGVLNAVKESIGAIDASLAPLQ